MNMIRKVLITLILLLVVVVAWVGLSVFYKSEKDTLPGDLATYSKSISSSFDLDELQQVTDRIEESYPTQPKEFLDSVSINDED